MPNNALGAKQSCKVSQTILFRSVRSISKGFDAYRQHSYMYTLVEAEGPNVFVYSCSVKRRWIVMGPTNLVESINHKFNINIVCMQTFKKRWKKTSVFFFVSPTGMCRLFFSSSLRHWLCSHAVCVFFLFISILYLVFVSSFFCLDRCRIYLLRTEKRICFDYANILK